MPHLSRWTITRASYDEIPTDAPATWHADPPYQANRYATDAYGTPPIDYVSLGTWCRNLRGQVMVHEQAGADWLPFATLNAAAATGRASTERGRGRAHEVWWCRGMAWQGDLFGRSAVARAVLGDVAAVAEPDALPGQGRLWT